MSGTNKSPEKDPGDGAGGSGLTIRRRKGTFGMMELFYALIMVVRSSLYVSVKTHKRLHFLKW